MLSRFLEYSLATPDVQASVAFYAKLGFWQAQVGEAWPHPYAVVTDGRIHLGLHQESIPTPSITFVQPDLLKHLSELEQQGLEFEFIRLGNDVFNEIGWLDPSGQLIRLVEARTFSPSKRPGAQSLCGYFSEIALPVADATAAKFYWENFGFVGMDETEDRLPHISCTSDTIDIGLYDPSQLRRAALRFDVDDVGAALGRLADAGVEPRGEIPAALRPAPAAVLTAPEGTTLLMC